MKIGTERREYMWSAPAKKRAIQLRANLELPSPGKDEKSEKGEEAVVDSALNDSLSRLCALIRSFVTNLNESPTNNRAGEQARRDLVGLIELSEKIVALLGPAALQPTDAWMG